MGEVADAVLDGLLYQECVTPIDGEQPGYPRVCMACMAEFRFASQPRKRHKRRRSVRPARRMQEVQP